MVILMMRFDGSVWNYYGPPGGLYPGALSQPALTATSYDGKMVIGGLQLMPYLWLFELGQGTLGPLGGTPGGPVHALRRHENDLLAGGAFGHMAGNLANCIARWNGDTWSALGEGIHGTVLAIEIYDDQVIAGGSFDSAGGVAANNIAAWDGASWHPLGDGVDNVVTALAVHDNALIVGGEFTSAGGMSTNNIAQWYSATWSPLGSGVDGRVEVLLAYDTAVYVGGRKQSAKPFEQTHLMIGLEAPAYHHADYFKSQVLAGALGGGMSSRLFQEIRERRGLCYSVYAFSSGLTDSGLFVVHAAGAPDKADELFAVIRDELERAANDGF